MPKYRLLTKDELENLEPEFIQYLSSNGIDAEKWKSILKNDKIEMDMHIELFSDVVMQKTLEKINYLEHRTSTDIKLFHFEETQAFLFALKSKTVDLLELTAISKNELDNIDLFNAQKKYNSTRELEIFELLNQGCTISKGEFYYQLKKITKK